MRILQGHLHNIYTILSEGGVWSTVELCDQIGFTPDFYNRERLRSMIGALRKKFRQSCAEPDNLWMFNNNNNFEELSWVGTSFAGYTLIKDVSTRAFECKMRSEQSIGIALNGAPAFSDFKKLAPKAFIKMSIETKPKLLTVKKLLK